MQRGEPGGGVFVLLRGKVAIETIKTDGIADTVKIASIGDVFGLAALMCGKPRVATATVLGEAEVLSLDWGRLQRIARLYPRSAYLLFKNLSAITGERLANQAALPAQQLSAIVSLESVADGGSCGKAVIRLARPDLRHWVELTHTTLPGLSPQCVNLPSATHLGEANRSRCSAVTANDRSVTGTVIVLRLGCAGDKAQAIPNADHLPQPL